MVKRLDEALGRLLDALRSLNLYDNTVVLFTSDHACHFKTRNSEYKRSCHESSIRVPTALHGGPFTSGGQIAKLVSLIDLPPTLLDAAGLPIPSEMQGRSILPLVRHTAQDWPEEVFVQISESQCARSVRTRRWKYCVVAHDKNGGKDSCSDRYSEDALYDLYSDPYELRNLIAEESHRETSEVMRDRLLRRMVAAGEAKAEIIPATRKSSGQRKVTAAEARE
jgi:arylsulfatase A-like enzyme